MKDTTFSRRQFLGFGGITALGMFLGTERKLFPCFLLLLLAIILLMEK